MGERLFRDRREAGQALAGALQKYGSRADVIVLALPRGGVPVAYEVATALNARLDVIVVRKLGVPFEPELGMGAIGEGGVKIINDEIVRLARVSQSELDEVEQRERAELERRARLCRGDRSAVTLAGRVVIVVDDGIATGSTARAACQVARAQGARHVVLAAPVGPPGVQERLVPDADEVVCLHTPAGFFGIGGFYADFAQTRDEQVVELLDRAAERAGHEPALTAPARQVVEANPPRRDSDVTVRTRSARLEGHLCVPEAASGVVVFVHGSGSSRHSPRNRHVAAALNERGLGTLLFDLLTAGEESDRGNVFDIDLLAGRLLDVTAWLHAQPDAAMGRIGYFGASTGAAAALSAAADPDTDVCAAVSRGGRPDLAGPRLALVRAPTLLIVGGLDNAVLELNRAAQARLRCENRLEIVPGATHLFEEPGTLDAVARLAADWFVSRFTPVTPPT